VVSYAMLSSGVTASLVLGKGMTGAAGGDHYTSVEGLTGSVHDDILSGDFGRNTLRGLWGEDTLRGLDGVDRLSGGGSDDYLDGGDDWDCAVFDGNRADYAISTVGHRTMVTGLGDMRRDGTDTLVNIEAIEFADDMVYL